MTLRRIALVATALIGLLAASPGPSRAAEPATSVVVERNIEIPTRSGHVLRGDLYRPAVDGRPIDGLPTIMTYFPYVKDDPTRFEIDAMQQFAAAGYAGLLVDIPGTGASVGTFGFLSEREIADGRDALDWAAAQPFSNGRTAMWGYSYPGLTAFHIAATRPPSLRAVVPASSFNDAYREVVFPGGILTTQDGVLLPFLTAFNVARQRPGTDPGVAFEEALDTVLTPEGVVTLAEAPTHQFYDAYWQERALENRIGAVEVPTLLWSGWSDIYPRGTLLNHHMVGAEHVRLVMGPWGHLAGAGGEPLQLFIDESLRWFDTFLRSDPTDAEAGAVTGARIFDVDWNSDEVYAGTWPGRFVDLETWPPTTDDAAFVLCAEPTQPDAEAPWVFQGTLGDECATDGTLPVLPLPGDATGGGSIGHDTVADPLANALWDDKDQRLSLGSTAFLTEPFDAPVTLTGPMELELSADTLGVDADWVVRVVDVGPDGTRVIAPGWLRASRRATDPNRDVLWHTHDADDPLTPGEPYAMQIEIWPASYRIPAGHRLGVLLRTADTLKVAPGVGQLASNVRVGPSQPSVLHVPLRVDAANPSLTTPSGTGTSVPTPGPAAPGTTERLPATGGGVPFVVSFVLAVLAVLARAAARCSTTAPGTNPRRPRLIR